MKKLVILSLTALLLILTACAEEKVSYESFLDRTDQTITERQIFAELSGNLMVNLSEHQVYRPGTLAHNQTHLYLQDFGENKIIKISKENPDSVEIWNISEGEGPGEVHFIGAIAANEERVFIGDNRTMKVVELDADGQYVDDYKVEFSPGRLALTGSYLINTSPSQQSHLFIVFDAQADSLRGFGEEDINPDDMMKHTGYLAADENEVFYAGYSEPLLRKYSTDGELFFSRSTIDNFDTKNNYENRQAGEMRMYGFSEDAIFSSLDLDVNSQELFILPHHNGDENFRFIDLYDRNTGKYIHSFQLDYAPTTFVVDESNLYTLQEMDDDFVVRSYPLGK